MLLGKESGISRKKWPLIVGGGILLAAILLGLALFLTMSTTAIQRDTYQLVKLSNGETYIGKLANTNGDFLTLNDAYHHTTEAGEAEGENSNITITKLSATVAKPEDTIHIAKEQIMYWENLQEGSKILDAITNQ